MKNEQYTASDYKEYMRIQEKRSRDYVNQVIKNKPHWFSTITELPLYSKTDFSGTTHNYKNFCLESKIREANIETFKKYKTIFIEVAKYNALMDAYENEDYEALPLYINFLNNSNSEFLFINLLDVPKEKLKYKKLNVTMHKTGKTIEDAERYEIPIEFFNYYKFDEKNKKYLKKTLF